MEVKAIIVAGCLHNMLSLKKHNRKGVEKIATFLTLWEIDPSKLPEKPEEQLSLYIEQLNMIKEEVEEELENLEKLSQV